MCEFVSISEIGKRLKELREKSNKTQEEVSAALEMRRAKYSKLEAGLQDFKTDDIVKICNYFKISSDYLLGISKTPSLDTDLQAVCKYTGLSENAVKQITTDGFIFVFDENEKVFPYFRAELVDMLNNLLCNADFISLAHNLNNLSKASYTYINKNLEINPHLIEKVACTLSISSENAMSLFENKLKIVDNEDLPTELSVDVIRYQILKLIEKINDTFDYRNRLNSAEEWKKYFNLSNADLRKMQDEYNQGFPF